MIRKVKISQYAKEHHVTYRTVWKWIADGKVKVEKTDTGRNLVLVETDDNPPKVVTYSRISSSENKDNLEKQKERLRLYCAAKGYKIEKEVTEIGSGLNDNRPKLEKILSDPTINIIVVEHKDRFARFGINYIQKLLELGGRKIEIINDAPDNTKEDLIQDFTSIITTFCSKIYGNRRSKRKTKKLIEELEKDKDDSGTTDTDQENEKS